MKKLKYLLGAFLFAMVLVLPIGLVGCTKHYKVNISIVEGSGSVYTVNSMNTPFHQSLLGENKVDEGSKFEFVVTPDTYYEVYSIKVNGQTIYNIDEPNGLSPTEHNSLIPCITITGKTNIEISFKAVTFTASKLYYNSGTAENPVWTILVMSNPDDQVDESIDRTLSMPYDKTLVSNSPQTFEDIDVCTNSGDDPFNPVLTSLREKTGAYAGKINFGAFKLNSNQDLYFNCTDAQLVALLDSFTLV